MKIKEIRHIIALIMCITAYSFPQAVQLENAFPNLQFNQPVYLTHSNDGTDRLFVVQQNGLIYVFPNDSSTGPENRRVFLNVVNKISSAGGEQGLLGLAFHPNYAENGYFYINYTAPSPLRTIVARYSVNPENQNKADSLSEFKIIEIAQPYTNHNGGMILFGTDGYLYIGMGDGGSGGDPQNHAQNLQSLLGKILRIDVDTVSESRNYSIPPTNPFFGDSLSGREEIFAWGLRNPWRFSQDPVTGYIVAGDVGQNLWEEINLVEAGNNYGWRCYEGDAIYNTSLCGDSSLYTFPLKTYPHPTGGCSVTGGYIYRGSRRPDLVGDYLYGDYCSGDVHKFHYDNGSVTGDTMIYDGNFSISSFGVDQNNELYICDYSNGAIRQFVPDTSSVVTETLQYNVMPGWNLLSLPLIVPDGRKTVLYPTAVSDAFVYENSYIPKDTLYPGTGYWLKFESSETIDITGFINAAETVAVVEGWNIIGTTSYEIHADAVIQEPSDIVISDYFYYDGGYATSVLLEPGKGYWIKTSSAGKLILPYSSSLKHNNLHSTNLK